MAFKRLKLIFSADSKIQELQDFILEQAKIIELLRAEIATLRLENEKLKAENNELRQKLKLSPESPACPSGAKPNFIKPDTKDRDRKPGQKKGHKGASRTKPDDSQITKTVNHDPDNCPDCNNPLRDNSNPPRSRIVIDIQLPIRPEITKHNIHSKWCPSCKAMKEEPLLDVLPGSTIGIKTYLYSAYQHYYLGMSISKIIKLLKIQGLDISMGGLIGGWNSLATLFTPFYKEIAEAIRNEKGPVYADETGHRQKGKKYWLWSFSTKKVAFYAIRKLRSGKIVLEILGKVFEGILITDFWKPYLAVQSKFRQWCIAHFLREFKKVKFATGKSPPEFLQFEKKVKRLFKDAIRFAKRKQLSSAQREIASKRFLKRLDKIVIYFSQFENADVKRLTKRLRTYREGFFTFVANADVDSTNNHSERMIRFAVIIRKISLHTMSEKGSQTMSILISIFKTLELQGHDVFQEALEMAKKQVGGQLNEKVYLAA